MAQTKNAEAVEANGQGEDLLLPGEVIETGTIALELLRPHPRNYREHPEDQLLQIEQSLREHGPYRNVVIARDNTILAGHGVWKAATRMGLTSLPFMRLDYDPDDPKALKVLAGDNELSRLAEVDDRALTEILRTIKESDEDVGLLGTGFDDAMLANLVMVTRPASEIGDLNEAAQWVGMPEYEGYTGEKTVLSLLCDSVETREKLVEQLGLQNVRRGKAVWSSYWPDAPLDDSSSTIFDG